MTVIYGKAVDRRTAPMAVSNGNTADITKTQTGQYKDVP